MLMEMLIDYPVLLTHRKNLLRIPGMEKIHPLHSQLNLIACRLSDKIWKTKEFQIKLPKSYCLLGEAVRKNNMLHTSRNGLIFIVKDILIHLNRL
jgi:hypothetical protein